MKFFKYFLLLAVISSCSTVRVSYDYDEKIDFSQYRTYNYYSDLDSGLSELDSKRLLRALDKALQAKGLTISTDPDFYINIVSAEYENAQASTVGVGLGGGGRNVGGGISVGIPLGRSSLARQIIFDFVDEHGKGLIWQAVSDSNFNPDGSPEERQADLQAVVVKVVKGFPPKN